MPPITVGKLTIGPGSSFEGIETDSGDGAEGCEGVDGATGDTWGEVEGLGSGDVTVFGDVIKSQVLMTIMTTTPQKTKAPMAFKQPFTAIAPLIYPSTLITGGMPKSIFISLNALIILSLSSSLNSSGL